MNGHAAAIDGVPRCVRGGDNPTRRSGPVGPLDVVTVHNGAMIGRMSRARHVVVGAAIGGTSLLGATGVIGDGDLPERYDTWQVVIRPEGADGLRFSETFDQDFGDNERSGHRAFIPHDIGKPIDIVASSPDAPDDLFVDDLGIETEIRIGDPAVKITGQHRYSLAYTLPAANLGGGVLSVDVLDPDPVETDTVEIVLTGWVLDDPRCFVGAFESTDECVIERAADGTYRAVIEPLPSDSGVTIEADIVDRTEPVSVDPLPLPDRRSEPNRGLVGLGLAALGGVGAVPVYRWARRRGANEVYAGGAVDAAYGELPSPNADGSIAPPPPVTMVPDDEMADLATIEFVPPKGIAPWEASVLLTERLGDDAVEAWISGLVAAEAIEVAEQDQNLRIASGPRRSELPPTDAALLAGILSIRDPYTTGKYNAKFAAAWRAIHRSQQERIASSGWWKRMAPGGGMRPKSGGAPIRLLLFGVFFLIWTGSTLSAFLGAFRSWWLAVAVALLFPALIAFFVYRVMLPARSAQGSALALRAESFRRFLHASEARHVEWAWSQGILREYSAWAVALGEADAWSEALDRANVPAPARAAAGPIIVHRRGPSMRTTRTAPSESSSGSRGSGFRGSGRGGGSRGGRVGGGGGGRSRGSF